MEDLAVQLFKLGDQEEKGFIVKRDMQRLQAEVSLPPDQLEAVFESLDSSHTGYLTLNQFIAGVSDLSSEGDKESDRHSDSSEPDLYVQRLLNLNVLHRSGELMCEVRGLVGRDDTWHQLLAALFSDLNQLLRQISQLEDTVRSRDHQHQQELQRIYDEFEAQITEERTSHSKQMSKREERLKRELAEKQLQVTELEQQRDWLQERLKECQTQLSHQKLSSPHNSYASDSSSQIRESETEVVELDTRTGTHLQRERAVLQSRTERSYTEGFRVGHHLAMLQEEGLVKQLRLLQAMQENLKSGKKEEMKKQFTYEDF